jgi:hypothetical protein
MMTQINGIGIGQLKIQLWWIPWVVIMAMSVRKLQMRMGRKMKLQMGMRLRTLHRLNVQMTNSGGQCHLEV